nr:hypothetical protein Iba_chr04aCG13440 [Ipomoea batatas]GMC82277.1 hypothetical protein Iba_chr04bCG11910 [Ipomoea batatas]
MRQSMRRKLLKVFQLISTSTKPFGVYRSAFATHRLYLLPLPSGINLLPV